MLSRISLSRKPSLSLLASKRFPVFQRPYRIIRTSFSIKVNERKPLPEPAELEAKLKKSLANHPLLTPKSSLKVSSLKENRGTWAETHQLTIDDKEKYVLRVVSEDNINEIVIAHLTSLYGISPQIHYINFQEMMFIRDLLPDNKTAFQVSKDIKLVSIGNLLRKYSNLRFIHSLPADDPAIFTFHSKMAAEMDASSKQLVSRYHHLNGELKFYERKLVHGDLHPDNILYRGIRPFLHDFEFATVGSPLLDVATFSLFLRLQVSQQKKLLETIYGKIDEKLLTQYFKFIELASLRYFIIFKKMPPFVFENPQTWFSQDYLNRSLSVFFKTFQQEKGLKEQVSEERKGLEGSEFVFRKTIKN